MKFAGYSLPFIVRCNARDLPVVSLVELQLIIGGSRCLGAGFRVDMWAAGWGAALTDAWHYGRLAFTLLGHAQSTEALELDLHV